MRTITLLIRMAFLGSVFLIIETGASYKLKQMINNKYGIKVNTRIFGANYIGVENLHISIIKFNTVDKKTLDKDRL